MRNKNQIILNKNLFPTRIFLIIAVLIMLSIACNVPLMASQNNQERPAGFVETSVAETMIALGGDQGQNGNGQTDQGSTDPEETATPEIPDTATLTPTVTVTPTPEIAMVFASENTNCRSGQGTDFGWLVTLLAGEEAEAVGIDPSGEYWYIRRPDLPNSFCWMWGTYATPSGPYQSLPVFTPIPTPTVGMLFSLKYTSLETCGGQWGLVYEVVNTGMITLESWRTTATDHTGGSNPQVFDNDVFSNYNGCNPVNQQNDLTAGEGQHVLMIFNNNPTGHDITTKVKVCTADALAGECISRTIRHTP